MLSNVSRRAFLRTSAATATGIGIVGPMGLLSVPCLAAGAIPTGEYLNPLSESQYWFGRLTDTLPPDKLPDPNSPESQLSVRLGLAGGFAVGFFSTIGFLGQYKKRDPKSYLDLLVNAAGLPSKSNRVQLILGMLASHRQFADLSGEPSGESVGTQDTASVKNGNADDEMPPKSNGSTLSQPLEKLERIVVDKAISAINWAPGPRRAEGIKALLDSLKDIPNSDALSSVLQQEFESQFVDINSNFESRFAAIDTSRLTTFSDGGELKLEWVDSQRLGSSYARGVEQGRLAGLGHHALLEANQKLTGAIKEKGVSGVNEGVMTFSLAESLVNCFGSDDFAAFGLRCAAFKPAIRLKSICFISSSSDPVKRERIEITTPFLPFTYEKQPTTEEQQTLRETNAKVARTVLGNLANLAASRYEMPVTTASLPQGAFEGCAAIHRHTYRLLKSASLRPNGEALATAKLDAVAFIPEATSPWTFAGVAAALCNTYLVALHQQRLKTPQDRIKYKETVDRSVDQLLIKSTRSRPEEVLDSSGTGAALLQYASGYRAARLFASWVSDTDAQADGARRVYASLQTALPEHFKALPKDTFLTADQIASNVLVIGTQIRREIEELRIRVATLEAQLEQYKTFVDGMKTLIDQLQGELHGVKDIEALRRFQSKGSELIERMKATATDVQKMALQSVNGLINTFVQVGVDIDITVRASVQGNVGSFNVNK